MADAKGRMFINTQTQESNHPCVTLSNFKTIGLKRKRENYLCYIESLLIRETQSSHVSSTKTFYIIPSVSYLLRAGVR